MRLAVKINFIFNFQVKYQTKSQQMGSKKYSRKALGFFPQDLYEQCDILGYPGGGICG